MIPDGGKIEIPFSAHRVDYEAELGVIIGKTAKNVPESEAEKYIFGFTCVNDVTARAIKTVEQPIVSTRFKNFDNFCPLGPYIETEVPDPQNITIRCRVNDREVVRGNTGDLLYTMGEMVAWVSTVMTLYLGDIICTGSPDLGLLHVGEVVEVECEGIGTLRNPVVAPR